MWIHLVTELNRRLLKIQQLQKSGVRRGCWNSRRKCYVSWHLQSHLAETSTWLLFKQNSTVRRWQPSANGSLSGRRCCVKCICITPATAEVDPHRVRMLGPLLVWRPCEEQCSFHSQGCALVYFYCTLLCTFSRRPAWWLHVQRVAHYLRDRKSSLHKYVPWDSLEELVRSSHATFCHSSCSQA